jgi:hypothetical protein
MPYGTIKVDTITFTNGGVDKSISISGLAQNPTFTGNVTATGTISGNIIQGGTTVSGLTVTGTTANFVSGVFTTQISGAIVKVPAGTAAIPSLQIGTGTSVSPGLYSAGTDLLGISTGGASAVIIDSVGQLRVINTGSAAAPALVVGNDLNTGIYSPGADQLAISTGGTGRVFVDASGNIGVGTASPASLLHVDNGVLNSGRYGAPGSIVLRSAAGTQASPTVISTSTNVAVVVGRGYDGTAYRDVAAIGVNSDGAISSTSSPGFISFNTTPSGSVATTERARIDSSGRLLVGTSSSITAVTFPAQVQTNSFYSYSASLFSADASGSNFFFLKSRNATTGSHTVVQANDVLGQTQYAGSDGTAFITGAAISAAVDGTPGTNDMPGRLVFSTTADGASSPTERLRIDSSGRVGIGTTAPGDIVSVTGGNLALQSTGGAGAGDRPTERRLLRSDIGSVNGLAAIGMNGAGTNGFLGEIKFYTGSADLFNTALAERARIDSSGRLLVGTSSVYNVPTGDGAARSPGLQRVASTFADSSISSVLFNTASGGGGTLQLGRSNTTTVGTEAIAVSGDVAGSIYFSASDGAAQIRAAQIFAAIDGTPGLNDMPGRLVFSTTADGASSPTERLRIASTGAFGLSGANYGTSGQVLTSNGSGSTPTWTTISTGGDVFLSANNAFTGANTFYNSTGQTFGTATSTQDGIVLAGRVGGTTSLRVTLQPTTLTASRTLTLPDVTGTVVVTGSSGTVSNTMLANSSVTVNGTAISLGGTGTVTANTTNALTLNNGGAGASSGSTFNGSAAVTLSYNTIGAAGLSAANAFTGANTFYNGTGQTFGTATSTQDGIILAGRAGGTTSLRVTIQPGTLTTNRTLTLPDASGTVVLSDANNSFTGTNTFYNSTGQTFGTATSTQDGIVLAGRAGGTTSLRVTIQPGTLTTSRTLTLPDVTGTVVTTGDTGTVTSNMIANGTIADADINASAAIAYSKLANMTAGSILLGNASNVPTVTAMSGDVTITSGGVTSIGTGVIVNADVNASAAIAGTKISPDFGSQNIITTGSVQGSLKAESAISTVSVSTATFSSIPSWVKRIHLLFSDVSTTGADTFGIRVGTSGGIVSTGYSGANFRVSDGGTPSVAAFSTEFTIVFAGSSGAASIYSGSLTLSNITGNTWVIGGTFAANATGTNNRTGCLNGYIALAGALTQVQLVDITSAFDAGSFNILYEG